MPGATQPVPDPPQRAGVYAAAVVAWILCVAFIGFLLGLRVYIGAIIQAYIAAKNFNECNGTTGPLARSTGA